MPPSEGAARALVLSMGLCAAVPAWAEGSALCDVGALPEPAQREFEAGVTALKRDAHEAVPPLRHALEVEPRAAVVRMVLGSALAKVGQTEAAAQEYAAFISACPKHPRAGHILQLLSDYVRARGQAAPEPVTVTAPAGSATAPETPMEGALCDARQLQGPARERYVEGERRLKQARFAEAEQALRGALEVEPKAVAAQLLLGTTYAKLGQVEAGANAYASFLAACPAHPKAPTVRKLLAEYRGTAH